ncbi:MAG: transglutaminase family protein [Burkholderiaceae bacterium]
MNQGFNPGDAAAAQAARYDVEHETLYEYTAPVSQSWQLARLRPRDLAWQKLLSYALRIDPHVDEQHETPDSFGNANLHFALHRAHRTLRVQMNCSVEVQERAAVAKLRGQSWERVRESVLADPSHDDLNAARMCEPTRLVPLSLRARDYAQSHLGPGRDWLEGVLALMHAIHADFEFEPGATTVSTSVDEVLAQRRGVCQDFAHLMLAGLRSLGLPARYVCGYLLTDPPPGQPRLAGVDATHAWVAAYAPDLGWVEFDPTNDQMADRRYITLAWGCDFADVVPLRGVILGGGEQKLEVRVSVVPA